MKIKLVLVTVLAAILATFAGSPKYPPLPSPFVAWYDRVEAQMVFEFPTEGGSYYYLQVQTPPSTNWPTRISVYFVPTWDDVLQTNVLTTNQFTWVPESDVEFYRIRRRLN